MGWRSQLSENQQDGTDTRPSTPWKAPSAILGIIALGVGIPGSLLGYLNFRDRVEHGPTIPSTAAPQVYVENVINFVGPPDSASMAPISPGPASTSDKIAPGGKAQPGTARERVKKTTMPGDDEVFGKTHVKPEDGSQ